MDNTRDKEPEQLASIAVSKDEIASRNRTSGGTHYRANNAPSGSGSSKVLWAVSIFAVLLSIALLVQLQQLKSQTDKQLKALTILQDRLSSTDEQANLSVDAMKILLRDQDHEIRKLWDVANKRNKNKISKNTQRLDDQSKLVTKHDGKLAQLSKADAKAKKELSSKLNTQSKEIDELKKDLETKQTALSKKMDKTLASLPSNVGKTLKEHGQGIKAMDATRLQLMKRINGLEKQIKALKKSAKPAVATP